MAVKLGIQDKPYTVVEGIWNAKNVVPEDLPEAEESKVILYAGTLHRKYGIETLLDAFTLVKDPKAQLWICGSGDMTEEICKHAQKDTRIQYKGYVSSEEVACLCRKATVLVNPRPNEGEFTKYSFPSKTMGYMASGKPVIMNKLDGIPSEYDPYLIYATDNSSQALASALQKVLDMSNEERIAFGSMAKKFVNTQKTSCVQAKKILDLIARNE